MSTSRVLLINESDCHDATQWATDMLEADGIQVELHDTGHGRMGDLYDKWLAAHGIIIVTQAHGERAELTETIRLAGWDNRKHLGDRAYGVVVHGDVARADSVRRGLTDWLDRFGLINSATFAPLDRLLGYDASEAGGREVLDTDLAFQQQVRTMARAMSNAVGELRAGRLTPPDRRGEPRAE